MKRWLILENGWIRFWVIVGVTLATLIAGLLRLDHVGSRGMWLDEIHTYDACNIPATPRALAQSWWSSYTYGVCDPPLYYALSFLTANGEKTYNQARLRAVSVVAGTACVPAAYFLLSALGGPLVGLMGACLMAVSTFAIQYSQEHRPYALFLLLSILFLHAAILSARRTTFRTWLYMTLMALLLIYTHYFGGIVVIAALPVWLLSACRLQKERGLRGAALALAGMCIALTIAYIPVMLQWPKMVGFLSPAMGKDTHGSKIELQLFKTTSSNVSYIKDLLWTLPTWRSGQMPLAVVWVSWGLAALGVISLLIRNRALFASLLLWVILGWIMTLMFYGGLMLPYDARRSIYLVPLFIFLLVEGVLLLPNLAMRKSLRAGLIRASQLVASLLFCGLLGIYSWGFYEYANSGYRNEPGQADWEGGVKELVSLARPGDMINVLPLPDTWLANHFKFYKRIYGPKAPVRHLENQETLAATTRAGTPIWTFIDRPHRHKKELLQYLTHAGIWTPVFGGALVFLPPKLNPKAPENICVDLLVKRAGEYALGFSRRVDAYVQLDGETTSRLHFKNTTFLPPQEMKAGVYRAEVFPEPGDTATTPAFYKRIKEGEWQSALDFESIDPSSPYFDFPLHQGTPYLSMTHNGCVTYTFFIDDPGEYDLDLDVRHDKPGPIKVKVYDIEGTELGNLEFSKANNEFEPGRLRLDLKRGPNRLKLYYHSFERLAVKQRNPEDDFNCFDLLRWRLVIPRGD